MILDLPPGSERTVQYADFFKPFDSAQAKPLDGAQAEPRVSFVLVTIPSDVARGVVARSVAALSKRQYRILGYVENMSGYYCRDCNDVKPLFASPNPTDLGIPCLGTVPFDPELARNCDLGIPFEALRESAVGRALDGIAGRLLKETSR